MDYLNKFLGFVFLFAIAQVCLISANNMKIEPGKYRIENAFDTLVLTVQSVGGNASFAKVVAENWHNYKEQYWEVKHIGKTGYQMIPEKFRSNNPLTYFKDLRKKYPTPVIWTYIERKDNAFNIENQRTRFCLSSQGRRVEVAEVICDKFSRAQQWKFTKV